MTGFDAYRLYTAIQLHFAGKYDFFKYGGALKVSEEKFEKNRHKYFFHKIAREWSEERYIQSTALLFFNRPFVASPQSLLSRQHKTLYAEDSDWRRNWAANLNQDIESLGNLRDAIAVTDGQDSVFIEAAMGETIHINSVCLLLDALKIPDSINPAWQIHRKKCELYAPFLYISASEIDEESCTYIISQKIA